MIETKLYIIMLVFTALMVGLFIWGIIADMNDIKRLLKKRTDELRESRAEYRYLEEKKNLSDEQVEKVEQELSVLKNVLTEQNIILNRKKKQAKNSARKVQELTLKIKELKNDGANFNEDKVCQ